jgi:hypothetical protein
MENKRIATIALSVLSIVSLLMLALITSPQNIASAINASDFTFGGQNFETFYQSQTGTYVSLQKTSSATSTKVCFLDAQSTSPSTEQLCITLYPQKDGCDVSTVDPINYNPCAANYGTTDCDTDFPDSLPCSNKTGISGNFGGLWCGATYCFILFESVSAYSDQLIRIWSLGVGSAMTGDVSGYFNSSGSAVYNKLYPYIWGYDECNPAPPNCGLGGITIFWAHLATAGSGRVILNKAGGTSLMGIVSAVDTLMCGDATCVTGHTGVTGITGCRHCGGVITTTRILTVARAPADASRNIVLHNEALTEQASFSVTGQMGSVAMANSDGAEYLGNTKNLFLVAQDSALRTISTTGVVANAFTYASVGLVNYVKGFDMDFTGNATYYIWHGSGSVLASITQMNLTSITTAIDFDTSDASIGTTISGWVDGGQGGNSIAVGQDFNSVLVLTDSNKARLYYLNGFDDPADDDDEDPVDTGSTNGICNEGTVLDCVGGNNSVGGLATLTSTYNITRIGNIIGQGIGIIDPSNDDIKTNGVGLIFMLIMGTFFAGSMVATLSQLNTRGWINMSIKEIDPLFWLFLVVGVVSASFYFNWIPDLVFYGMMVGIAGLVSIGILKHFGKI